MEKYIVVIIILYCWSILVGLLLSGYCFDTDYVERVRLWLYDKVNHNYILYAISITIIGITYLFICLPIMVIVLLPSYIFYKFIILVYFTCVECYNCYRIPIQRRVILEDGLPQNV